MRGSAVTDDPQPISREELRRLMRGRLTRTDGTHGGIIPDPGRAAQRAVDALTARVAELEARVEALEK